MPRWQRAYSPSGVIYKWSVWPRALKKPDKKNPQGWGRQPGHLGHHMDIIGLHTQTKLLTTFTSVFLSVEHQGLPRSTCPYNLHVESVSRFPISSQFAWFFDTHGKKNVCFVSKLQAFSTIEEKSIGQKLTSHLLDLVYTTSVKKSSWIFHWKQHESTRILLFF